MATLYGLNWGDSAHPVNIEMEMIRAGGNLALNGKRYGKGLPFHYEALRRLLWPKLDDHRWHRLCRDEILKNRVTVLMGPGSSGKTHEASWIYLCEYFCWPDELCLLVSSTDIRGLRLRVWGEIAMLWQQAVEQFDFLSGHLLDSRIAITTDEMEDGDYNARRVRDMRKGIIGIPTVQSGRFVGLGKWCFPSGSLVDTVCGRRPIESIREGEYVLGPARPVRVMATNTRVAKELVRVHLTDGRTLDCTPDHPILTQSGWVNAGCLLSQHSVYSCHEVMRSLRQGTFRLSRPEEVLFAGVPAQHLEETMRLVRKRVHSNRATMRDVLPELRGILENVATGHSSPHDSRQGLSSYWKGDQPRHSEQPERNAEEEGVGKACPLCNQRMAAIRLSETNQGRSRFAGIFPKGAAQLENKDWRFVQKASTPLLSTGYLLAGLACCRGSGWPKPPEGWPAQEGCCTRPLSGGTRVDRVEILKPDGDPRYSKSRGGYYVHDLQVSVFPAFSVNGVVVHNCGIKQKRVRLIADEAQLMGTTFLSAFANLNKNEDFRAIILGNPIDQLDPLGKAAEPLDGWSSHLEPKKTEVWKTRFMGGTCVNLIGTDSPNFDFPDTGRPRYPYLISKRKIDETLSFFPKDSFEYYSQCVGCMKVGTLDDRIVTRELCRNHQALDAAIWKGSGTIRVCALDSAYGGDRAVCGHVDFGEDVSGHTVIAFNQPAIIPIVADGVKSPEEQLAVWVKDYCERNDIPPGNFFHDSTGRGGLGTEIARAWSAECNPVEFGGVPTDRPVSAGLFIYDMETQTRRLATCREHYDRLVSELHYQVRYAITSNQFRSLPEDVMDELCMRKWGRARNNKIAVETKEKMKERIGRSPDLADWCALCLEGARRLGFVIEKMPASGEESSSGDDYLQNELRRYRDGVKKRQLHYA